MHFYTNYISHHSEQYSEQLNFNVEESKSIKTKGRYVNTPFRVDEDLESNLLTKGEICLETYKNKGGSLYTLQFSEEKKEHESFFLLPGDIVYPSCSAGFCRSQTLWHMLTPYSNLITLFSPHATRYGFDPYNDKANWRRKIEGESKMDHFGEWSGKEKAIRFGFDKFLYLRSEENCDQETLNRIKEYYDKNYFSPCEINGKKQRRIYITFAENTHVILKRLNETNVQLDDVIVVSLDLDDYVSNPIEKWNTTSRSKEAYFQFSAMLNRLLDLS